MLSGSSFLSGFLHYTLLPDREVYDEDDHFHIYENYYIGILMCMGVIMGPACLALFASQIFLLVADKTTIETMKMGAGPYVSLSSLPAQKTVPEALSDVCGSGPFWGYFFPCRSRTPALFFESLQTV